MGKTLLSCLTAAFLAGCVAIPEYPPRVTAQLQPVGSGAAATTSWAFGARGGAYGTAVFEPAGDKVHLIVSAAGLSPGQQYGLAIHDAGDCSRGTAEPRALPAITADVQGRGTLETDVDGASVVGRSLGLHSGPDAGTQVACGAIRGS